MMNFVIITVLLTTLMMPGVENCIDEAPACSVILEPLTETLYLDRRSIPDDFDRDMLIRLHEYLRAHVVPNIRTPFPGYVNELPVIVRYVPFDEKGVYPATTAGFAGWCDVVLVDCPHVLDEACEVQLWQPDADESEPPTAFLALIALHR